MDGLWRNSDRSRKSSKGPGKREAANEGWGGGYKLSNRIRGWPPLCHSERAIKHNTSPLRDAIKRVDVFLRLPPPQITTALHPYSDDSLSSHTRVDRTRATRQLQNSFNFRFFYTLHTRFITFALCTFCFTFIFFFFWLENAPFPRLNFINPLHSYLHLRR